MSEKKVYADQKIFKSFSNNSQNWYWGMDDKELLPYKMAYLCKADPYILNEESTILKTKTSTRYYIDKSKFPEDLKEQYSIIFLDENKYTQVSTINNNNKRPRPDNQTTPTTQTSSVPVVTKGLATGTDMVDALNSFANRLVLASENNTKEFQKIYACLDEVKNSFIAMSSTINNYNLNNNNNNNSNSIEDTQM